MADMDKVGVSLFCGTWMATIRIDVVGRREIILAEMDECRTSGGCGAQTTDEEGIAQGEQ
jgi:hypothetical protein